MKWTEGAGRVAATSLLLIASACDNDPAKNKTLVSASQAVAVVADATPNGVRYTFSAKESKLGFVGAKITGKHEGSFRSFSGTVIVVEGRPERSSVTVEVDMASLEADDPKLSGHLRSPDFFDVATYPKARFVSTSVTQGGAMGATQTVTGNLELRGVTKSISIPATIHVRPESVDVDAEFAIHRKDFGVVYPGKPDDLIKDEFLMKLTIHATRE